MDPTRLAVVSDNPAAADEALGYLAPEPSPFVWWWRRVIAGAIPYTAVVAAGMTLLAVLNSLAGLLAFVAAFVLALAPAYAIVGHYDRADAERLVIRRLNDVIEAAELAIDDPGIPTARVRLANRLETAATRIEMCYGRRGVLRPKVFQAAKRGSARRCAEVVRSYMADAAVGSVRELEQLRDDMMRAVLRVAPKRWPEIAALRPTTETAPWYRRFRASAGFDLSGKVGLAVVTALVGVLVRSWFGK